MRTALTVEMWEAINGAYLELKAMEARRGAYSADELGRFLDSSSKPRSSMTAAPIAPCCATTPIGSRASDYSWSARTTRPGFWT